jgi:hypothetical protein
MVVLVEQRGDACRLQEAFADAGGRIQQLDGVWQVKTPLDTVTADAVTDVLATLSGWLVESELPSCRVQFGELTFVLLHPENGSGDGKGPTLDEPNVPSRAALEPSVAVNMATGFVAGNMDVSFEQAESLLRESAKNRRLRLEILASQIIASRNSPR